MTINFRNKTRKARLPRCMGLVSECWSGQPARLSFARGRTDRRGLWRHRISARRRGGCCNSAWNGRWMNLALEHRNNSLDASTLARRLTSILSRHQHNIGANRNRASILRRFRDIASYTLCPKKVSPLNILQQPPQTCTDLNEILHTQDDVHFCHRRQIS